MGLAGAIIPLNPGQFSAYGFLHAAARVDRQRTLQLTSRGFAPARAAALMAELVAEGRAELEAQGRGGALDVACRLDMRYLGQNYELELDVPPGVVGEGGAAALWDAFHAAHRARFGFDNRGEVVEIVTFSATVSAPQRGPELPEIPPAAGPAEPRSRRGVGFVDGRHDTPIFSRDDLRAGHAISGPAVVEEAASVTLVAPGQTLTVDRFGHLLLAA